MPALRRLLDLVVRPIATLAVRVRRRGRRPSGPGAHALAFTPERRLLLVKLRYARGWRVPGGGRRADETLEAAVLRELREEAGVTSHGAVRPLSHIDGALVLVEDIVYDPPRWSLEVERVIEADLDQLPRGLSPITRRWIAALEPWD